MLTIDTHSYVSPNYDDRPDPDHVRAIVLHDGEGTKASDLRELTTPGTKKSAHYYIDRAGNIYELVHPRLRAWHAGSSSLGGLTAWNDFAVGIESEHRLGQNWPAAQRAAFKALCEDLMAEYHIGNGLIVAHRWIAPTRKEDPTDWPDAELRPWIAQLRPVARDPLRAAQLPGIRAVFYCGTGFADFYRSHGGVGFFGYPLANEQRARGLDERDCTMMPCERAVLKYIDGEGVHLALLSEANALGWLL